MEAGAIQRYANNLKSYGDNIAGVRSALNEGVTLRQNNRLNAIATSQRQKLQNIFLSNVVEDEKLREIHEALGNLSIQAGAAPQALYSLGTALNKVGAFNPVKRAGTSLLQKVKSAGTSLRVNGTGGDDEPIEMKTFNPGEKPTAGQSLNDTIKSVKPPVSQSAPDGEGKIGKVGQNFDDEDIEDRFASLDKAVRPAGSTGAGGSTDPLPASSTSGAGAEAGEASEAAEAGEATEAATAGAEATEAATAGVGATEAATSAASTAASAAGAAAGAGTFASVMSVVGPLSILAGLGFGIFELVQAFKNKPHPDMKNNVLPSQVKQTQNQTPSHKTLSVAPSSNSALLQAGSSSAV